LPHAAQKQRGRFGAELHTRLPFRREVLAAKGFHFAKLGRIILLQIEKKHRNLLSYRRLGGT
jgi:hypothetical protein